MTHRVRVLMVCTGNICRSPTAEAVPRRLPMRDDRLKSIGGRRDYHPLAADHRAQQTASRRGYDLSRIRHARSVRATERFDLVLVMEQDQRALIRQCPDRCTKRFGSMTRAGSHCRTEVPTSLRRGAGFERVLDMAGRPASACATTRGGGSRVRPGANADENSRLLLYLTNALGFRAISWVRWGLPRDRSPNLRVASPNCYAAASPARSHTCD
jgi:protein-tyrosine phosphatase